MGNTTPIPFGRTNGNQKELLQAIRTKNKAAVQQLLSGAPRGRVNEVFASTSDLSTACHVTPLIAAVKYNSKEIVRVLLDHGADASFVDDMGWTALLYACHNKHNNAGIVELLCGNSVAGQNYMTHLGYTPLMLAAIRGHGDVLRPILKSSRVSINASASGSYGFQVTALMLATRYGYKHLMGDSWDKKGGITDTIIQLVDKGAYINVMDKATEGNGRTPILQAMHNDDFISMFYLVTGGADLSIQNHPVGKKPEKYLEVKLTSTGGVLEETQQIEEETIVTVKEGAEWEKFGKLIKLSLSAKKWEKNSVNITKSIPNDSKPAVPFIGADFMCNLYFEWRLLSAVYNMRGYGKGDASIEGTSNRKTKIVKTYFDALENFKTGILKKNHEKVSDESINLICFLLTCPKSCLAHIQLFFTFDHQINSWIKQLDTVLDSPSRNKWKDHWNNRLALKKQHVVKDQVNFSYGLRGTKAKFNGDRGRFDGRSSYCFGLFFQ
jgi:hypothetical protein